MASSNGFYDLLFEVSNEIRHGILLLLLSKAMRITDITMEMGLNNPETRRHISRLREVGLIQRDVEGFYNLTPFGETALLLLQEFYFLSTNKEYFQTHTLSKIPTRLAKGIGEISASMSLANAMDFLRHTENLCKEATDYVWLIVDQFPMYSVSTIVEAVNRGVEFRIIEPKERIFNTDLDVMTSEGAEAAYVRTHPGSMTSEETQALSLTRGAHLVEQRVVDEVNAYLFLSDTRCVIAFPTSDGPYDYQGFMASDDSSLKWCMELFQHYWAEAELRTQAPQTLQVERGELGKKETTGQIVVIGQARPEFDAPAIQNAVDNYDEVILKGTFNLGTSTVYINRSVVLCGEGREKDTPTTKIYKRGWTFPSYLTEFLLVISGEGIDVTIENIHFTDFNYCCIRNRQCNSVNIRDNRITLGTGRGRGVSLSNREDQVIGILSGVTSDGVFPHDTVIEGNYLDFDMAHLVGGFYTQKGVKTDPSYRPDLKNHESYCGVGICINNNSGKVIVRDNIIRNMNSRGIYIMDNYESADIHVVDNTIVSDVYGAYPFSSHIAGIGIQAQSSWAFPRSGTRVEISGNEIRCDKLNYCGIAVYGPSMYQEGTGKLGECIVNNNTIHLEDGHVGVLIRKNDGTEVYSNRISGRAYYGIHLWGSKDREGLDLGSNANLIEDNDLSDLEVKTPDEYSDSHVDGRMFTGSPGTSATAHVWLNSYSRRNRVMLIPDETVIDEGEDNEILYQEDTR